MYAWRVLAWALLMLHLTVCNGSRLGGSSRVKDVFTRAINEKKIKNRIMRGLNLTLNPRRHLGATRELPTRMQEEKLKWKEQSDVDRQSALVIFSGISASSDPDAMSFILDSRVRAIQDNIESAMLVLHLKDNGKHRRQGKKMRRFRRKMRPREDATPVTIVSEFTGDGQVAGVGGERQLEYTLAGSAYVSDQRQVQGEDRRRAFKHSRKLQRRARRMSRRRQTRRGLRRRRRQSTRKVKVVVRLVSPRMKRRRRISVTRVMVKKFEKTTLNLNIPREIISAAAASPNHSLTLQVTCRRCRKNIRVDRVLTPATKVEGDNKDGDEPTQWLNPYRPYLYIKQYKTRREQNGAPRSRQKRKADNAHKPKYIDLSLPWERQAPGGCYAERIWVTFEELGLSNLVLYPEGFATDVCRGSCSPKNTAVVHFLPASNSTSKNTFLETPSLSRQVSSVKVSTTPSASLAQKGHRVQKRRNKHRRSSKQQSILLQRRPAKSFGGHRNVHSQNTASRHPEEMKSSCMPLRMRPLKLWYLDPATGAIIPKEIPDLIQDSCGCAAK